MPKSVQTTRQVDKRPSRALAALRSLDSSLVIRFSNWKAGRIMDWFMKGLSYFGYGFLYPVIIGAMKIADPPEYPKMVPASFLAFFLEYSGMKGVKALVKRPRPARTHPRVRERMSTLGLHSFPSGHSAGAFVLSTLLAHYHPLLAVPFHAGAFLVAISRLYNGLHYPSDILAGSLLGLACAAVSLRIFF